MLHAKNVRRCVAGSKSMRTCTIFELYIKIWDSELGFAFIDGTA